MGQLAIWYRPPGETGILSVDTLAMPNEVVELEGEGVAHVVDVFGKASQFGGPRSLRKFKLLHVFICQLDRMGESKSGHVIF